MYKCLLGLGLILLVVTGCQTALEKNESNRMLLEIADEFYSKGLYAEAYSYYEQGIPFVGNLYATERHSSSRMRLDSPVLPGQDEDIVQVSFDSFGEECFFKAMNCLVKLGKYNAVILRYERYLDIFPNYSNMDEVANNIHFMIEKYLEWDKKAAAVRGYKLLLKIDPFSRDGRQAHFAIAEYYRENEHFSEAIEYYKDITAFFPTDSRLPIVLFKLGQSYFNLYEDIYYDFKSLDESQKYFNQFIMRVSSGELYEQVQDYLFQIKVFKAKQVLYKGQFYLRRGDTEAALLYFKEVVDLYKDTEEAVEAARILAAYKTEVAVEEKSTEKTQ